MTDNKELVRLRELAGIVGEDELSYLEDPNELDDIPSVKLHLDDAGNMRVEVSAFFHSPDNRKTALLKNNPALQDLVMKAIQMQMQKAFRRSVHGVLGIPYGLPENKK